MQSAWCRADCLPGSRAVPASPCHNGGNQSAAPTPNIKCPQTRVKEALLLEMLGIGPHVADKKEGGCHEVAHFCIDRGALRCALSYGPGATRDAELSRGARERIQV